MRINNRAIPLTNKMYEPYEKLDTGAVTYSLVKTMLRYLTEIGDL
jgi:hypothetical protein